MSIYGNTRSFYGIKQFIHKQPEFKEDEKIDNIQTQINIPEYILDYEMKENVRDSDSQCSNDTKFLFKIDKNGNVDIKRQIIILNTGRSNEYKDIENYLSIRDNIPIPFYLIEFLKKLIIRPAYDGGYGRLYSSYWYIIIDAIKQLKISLKEHLNNTDYITDIETKLNITTNKNVILETQIKEIEQKVKNIETLYFDTLKDNEKLKEEIVLLKETNINNLKSNENNVVLYNDLQLENEKLKYEMKILKFKLLNKHITV
jgi:hypothetical protein